MSAGVHAHAQSGRVTQRCHNSPDGKRGLRSANDGSVCGGFGGFEKSSYLGSWLGRRRLTFACSPKPGQWPCGRCRTCFGADGKASIERLCISLPYVETVNSKVIKGFVRVFRVSYVFFVFRTCFSCFGIPMFHVYMLRTFYVRFTYPYLAMVHTHELQSRDYLPCENLIPMMK